MKASVTAVHHRAGIGKTSAIWPAWLRRASGREASTRDVEAGDVAWGLLLHAWGEDIARLMGVDQFITNGVSKRLLERLLDSYVPNPAPSAEYPAPSAQWRETC